MGLITDLVSLVTKLDDSITDRKISELFLPVKKLVLEVKEHQFRLEQEHAAAMEKQRTEHAAETAKLQEECAEAAAKLQAAHANEVAQLKSQISELQKKHNQPQENYNSPISSNPFGAGGYLGGGTR